ncbi:MAG TPA: hypothetical protein VN540_10800 [Clostridia bacterium]|nr:hypothetical protein [Clostridia bacterium]
METKKPGILGRVLKIVAGAAMIALGLYFTIVAIGCTQVDGVHMLGYTLFPALALAAYLLAFLLLRKRRKTSKSGADGAENKAEQ